MGYRMTIRSSWSSTWTSEAPGPAALEHQGLAQLLARDQALLRQVFPDLRCVGLEAGGLETSCHFGYPEFNVLYSNGFREMPKNGSLHFGEGRD